MTHLAARVLRWLRGWLGRRPPPPPPPPDQTMIGRKLRLLGYDPGDAELAARARAVETRLGRVERDCLIAEQAAEAEGDHSALSARISRARRAASDFLAPRVGELARGVAAWPRVREPLLRAVDEGETLAAAAREALSLISQRGELFRRAGALEAQYAAQLPERWSMYTGEYGISFRVERAATARALAAIEESVSEAEVTLEAHLGALLKIEDDLLTALGEHAPAPGEGILDTACVEARVLALTAFAAETARSRIVESRARVDALVERHLEHLGDRSAQARLRGRPPGSFTHAMARLSQLRRAKPKP